MKTKTRKILIALLIVLGLVLLAVAGVMAYGKHQMIKIPGMTFEETLRYTTAGNPDAVITVESYRTGRAGTQYTARTGKYCRRSFTLMRSAP